MTEKIDFPILMTRRSCWEPERFAETATAHNQKQYEELKKNRFIPSNINIKSAVTMRMSSKIKEVTLVRHNLMTRPGYSPYCGRDYCVFTWPRTDFDGNQFTCKCGWRSSFPEEFMKRYKEKWNK